MLRAGLATARWVMVDNTAARHAQITLLRENALVARWLADNPCCLYAAPTYLAEHGVPAEPVDLARHRCLALTGMSHKTFLSGGKMLWQRISEPFTLSSVEALHQACLGGLGLTMLSAWHVRDDVAAGRLVPVLWAWEPETLANWAVYPTARLVPPKVRLFTEALDVRRAQA